MKAEQDRRSARRILVPPALLALVLAAAYVTRAATGDPQFAALVFRGGFGLLALWAVIDGARRAFGHPTFLGVGRGLDRLFGLIQLSTTIGLAIALLPNVIILLDALGQIVTDLG
jgi:hypothetical protein